MSCERCKDLCVEFRIRSSSELRKAISVADANLRDGTIVEVPTLAPLEASGASFASVVAGTTWDDFLAYSFKCIHCDEVFELSAETYHGSGGAWRPKNTASVHVSP